MARNYPFSAIVGQEDMKLAILIAALDSSVGGVLVMGDRGTGKSTAVRALAALLPEMNTVQECVYACDPNAPAGTCPICDELRTKLKIGGKLKTIKKPVPVVDSRSASGSKSPAICSSRNRSKGLSELKASTT